MSLRRLLFAALLFLAGFGFLELSSVEAQTFRGAINGTVADPSGAIVPGAQVTATDTATGIEHSPVSTGDGQFSFQDLPLGNYKVTVTALGFPPFPVNHLAATAPSPHTFPPNLLCT